MAANSILVYSVTEKQYNVPGLGLGTYIKGQSHENVTAEWAEYGS